MLDDLSEGDVAETVKIFFEESRGVVPATKSTLNIQQVRIKLRAPYTKRCQLYQDSMHCTL